MSKILVAEISGKRSGTKNNRPTEKLNIKYDHVIISNNSEGYETDWEIINVPQDYEEWYKQNIKTGESSWYAPMNRSYAIKYAKEHGYDILIQLDDNIVLLEIAYIVKNNDGTQKRYREVNEEEMANDFISMIACVIENTNACMVGLGLAGSSAPSHEFLKERYVYSFFGLNLKTCPKIFHGDFEDDIEYRLKCKEMGLPTVMICPLRYGKTGQKSNKDETGNRAAYTQAGLKRGYNMSILHGDIYSCGYSKKTASVMAREEVGKKYFKHKIKRFKCGICVKNNDKIECKMKEILKKYSQKKPDKAILKERKTKNV